MMVAAWGAKVKKPQDLWQLFIDGNTNQVDTIQALTAEEYAEIKKRHGIN